MTPYEVELAIALGQVSHFPGTSKKRFCRDMANVAEHRPEQEISIRQRYYMECLAWYYRRQLPAHFVPERKPLPLPPVIRKAKKAVQAVGLPLFSK